MTISPAYGRDYKSAREALKAWEAGKDFIIRSPPHAGRYINKKDWARYGGGEPIAIRYDMHRKAVHIP